MQRSPRALVADKPVRFPVFFEQLGDCLFLDWKKRKAESVVNKFVSDQAREILAGSTDVTARIFVEPRHKDEVSKELVVDGGPKGTLHILQQHGCLIEFDFKVDKKFWNSRKADWEPSVLKMTAQPTTRSAPSQIWWSNS